MPVEDYPVHERTRLADEAKHGCFNRPPFKPYYLSKAGYSTECVTDDPRCEGCRWKASK